MINRTISIWFKTDNSHSNLSQIIYEEDGSDRGLDIFIESGSLYFRVWDKNEGDWTGSYLVTEEITANNWHHAVLVLDTSQSPSLTAYLDSQSIEKNTDKFPSRANVVLGDSITTSEKSDIDNLYELNIGNTLVYERSLDTAEVDLLFEPNHNPVAVEDTALTVENQEITLFPAVLLDNDLDIDGDLLTLESVGNAVNGTVSQDSEGTITFTPDPGFNGEASFEYTLGDNLDGTDIGLVNLNVLPATSPIPVGTNLHRLADWSPQLPFLNGFKSSRRWLTQDINATRNEEGRYNYTWNTGEFNQLDLDERGWVKSLPIPEDDPEYTSVGTILYRDLGTYPGGEYVVLYEGEGTIEYGFDAVKNDAVSAAGRDVIDVQPTNAGIWLRITETDPNETGDYLRDIHVLPAKYEYADTQIFNPNFLDRIQPYNTLRFMDWMATNNSTQGEWSNRPTPDSSLFSGEIASLEEMVELANRTDTDPWFTIPHMATDEYIINFANYVKDNLDPELQVYVEYSNEVWNRDFDQGWWVEDRGIEDFADSPVGDFGKRIDWYSRRTVEIAQMWDDVFTDDSERVIGVMSGQAANSWTAKRALGYYWADEPLSHEAYGIDAISFAPYFASYLGSPDYEEAITSWTEDDDGGLDKLFEELTVGGIIEDGPTYGALQQSYFWTENYFDLAEQHDLTLLTYESGQHLRGNDGVEENQAITELFTTANRDSRMGEIYQEYFTQLHELGVDLSINYTDVSGYNKWGSWGVLEHIDRPSSPKYNVLQSLTANNSNNLPPQLGELTRNLSDQGLIVQGDPLNLRAEYTDVGLQDYHQIQFAWGDETPIQTQENTPLLGEVGIAEGSHSYNTPGIYTASLTVTDDDNLVAQKSVSVNVAQKVIIDWKPRSTSQQTNLAGNGELRVAILGMENLDVTDIDPTSVRADDTKDVLLNGNGVNTVAAAASLDDVNSDGLSDLVLIFDKPSLRSAVDTDASMNIDDEKIFLFASHIDIDNYFFFGEEI